VAQKPGTASRNLVEFGQRRGSNRIRPFPRAVAPAAAARGRVPVELGARAFDLLVALLEADGALVTKQALMSRVWPGLMVSKENLKVQVSSLRKALGADRDVILTDFGRGYRFTGVLTSNAAAEVSQRHLRSKPRSGRSLFAWNCRRSLRWSSVRTRTIKDT
jgi:DNA-binding winged helix-turn-helix (wHTH) protein